MQHRVVTVVATLAPRPCACWGAGWTRGYHQFNSRREVGTPSPHRAAEQRNEVSPSQSPLATVFLACHGNGR